MSHPVIMHPWNRWLGKRRAELGYTYRDLSRLSGIRPDRICDLERDFDWPTEKEIESLSRVLLSEQAA